jgi:hypothetical protein
MANPTSNYGWQMPTNTDLVKDLPADFEVFGQAVDTALVDLLGGTSGQILAKNSNTNMDFVWINNDQGDITAVTAGTGISGGGTSGAVTITNAMATEITAKGDLIVGTGNAAFDNLPAGTNGHVLTADSTVSPTGLKWAAPAGGGKLLQVVYASSTTQTSISSASYTDTGLSGSITPTLATSKILILVTQNFAMSYGANSGAGAAVQLLRGATSVLDLDGGSVDVVWFRSGLGNPNNVNALSLPVFYLDSPNTTSSTTYKTQGKLSTTSNSANITFQNDSVDSVMILMEIGA